VLPAVVDAVTVTKEPVKLLAWSIIAVDAVNPIFVVTALTNWVPGLVEVEEGATRPYIPMVIVVEEVAEKSAN
jgi:hypothetical protein